MDLLAGLTVGMTTVPQALAYAEVAGLPVQVTPLRLLAKVHPPFRYDQSQSCSGNLYSLFGGPLPSAGFPGVQQNIQKV